MDDGANAASPAGRNPEEESKNREDAVMVSNNSLK